MSVDEVTESLLDGRYRLGACLGRGATSAVYQSEDVQLGRPVAIKLLKRPEDMPMSLERIRTETAVLAALDHPSLVTLHDARLDPGHPQYLVMEYVDGPTLASRLLDGPLPPAEVAALAHDIADGLQAVHRAGVVHRDVKPSNVLIAAPAHAGDRSTAKLTDFGIAFTLDDARITSPGVAVGTAAYMAPEQVRATALTTAVDVYSLGLVLIEALTGEPAYPVSGGVHTALRRLTEPPVIPESVGDDWRVLLTAMTRTDPEQRPSAGDVARSAAALEATAAITAHDGQGSLPATALPSAADRTARGGEAGTTKEYPVRMAFGRRMLRTRLALAAAAGAAVVSLFALAGAWSAADPGETPAQIATHAPAPAQSTAPADAGVSTGSTTDGAGASSVESGATGTSQGEVRSPSGRGSNPNRGPGNNSGNGGQPPGQSR